MKIVMWTKLGGGGGGCVLSMWRHRVEDPICDDTWKELCLSNKT